jgi:hypothetical protein
VLTVVAEVDMERILASIEWESRDDGGQDLTGTVVVDAGARFAVTAGSPFGVTLGSVKPIGDRWAWSAYEPGSALVLANGTVAEAAPARRQLVAALEAVAPGIAALLGTSR